MLSKRSPLAKVREAAESRSLRRRALERDPQPRLAGDHDRRGARGPGARDGRAGDPVRGAGLRVRAVALPVQRLGRPVHRSRRKRRAEASAGSRESPPARSAARAAFEPRSNDVVPDADGAGVLVLNDGDEAVLVEPGDAEIEPVELIDATRGYARVSADGGDPLPGDVRGGRRPGRWSRSPRSSPGSPSGRWRWRSTTPRSASSSTARSAPTRRSRTAARRCSTTPRRRARSPTTRPGAPTPSPSRCRSPPRWPRPAPRTRPGG